MKVRLIQSVDGLLIKTEFDLAHVYENMDLRGYECTGLNQNTRHREELWLKPMFAGLNGPFWDGDAIRYEDHGAHDQLSA